MKTFLRRLSTVVIAGALCSLLTGCWDYRAINTRSAVTGIGFDPVPGTPDKMRITIQVPILSQSAGSSTSSSTPGTNDAFENISTEAYSVSEALRSLQTQMNRQPDIAELRIIVFNAKLSPQMMDTAVAQLIRVPTINRLARVVTTPDNTQEVFGVKGTDTTPMGFLDQAFNMSEQGYVVSRELWQYWRDATQVGVVPVVPIVTASSTNGGNGNRLTTAGVYVYLNNQISFTLTRKQTLYVNFLTGNVKNMALDVPVQSGEAALTNVSVNSRLRCFSQGNHVVLYDRVSISGTLAKVPSATPKPIPPTDLNWLQDEVSKYLAEQLMETIQTLQQHRADVIGFGRIYLQHHPEEEAKLKAQWGEVFQHAKPQIVVQVRISSKGELI